jgi:diguanylate cyclase (GGDEF)-like protein/PAS domain S-box-containing protein
MNNQDFTYILEKNSEYYALIESMLNGYAVNEIILDYRHEPVDYRFLEVNTAFEELTALKKEDLIGKNITEVFPLIEQSWIELCADVALNQKDICTEYYSKMLDRYYNVRIISRQKGIFLTIFNDITTIKDAHKEAERQRSSYHSLFENIRVGLIRTSIDEGRILKANPSCAELFGFDDIESFLQTSVTERYQNPDDRKKYRAKLLRNGKVKHAVLQMRKANNKRLTVAVSSTLHYEDNLPVWIDSTIQDISKQQRAEERLQMNSIVFEHTLEAVVISDKNHKILTVNKAFNDITGYEKKEVIGKDFDLLWCDEEDMNLQCQVILGELKQKGSWQGEVYKRHKNGHTFPAHLSVIEGDRSKDVKHYISIFYDITYRKQSEEKLFQLAHFDTLTGLCNRHAFMHQLKESIETSSRYQRKMAVLFLDLDGFKAINDQYGHDAGDEVLIATAARLKKIIRKSDTVARMGGDEFTVIIENVKDIQSLSLIAQKMIDSVSQDIKMKDSLVHVTTSIGISIYPDDALDLESMLRHADNAMYKAKELGKNNLQFFTKALNVDSVKQMIFEMELRHALEKDEFHISYQPQYSNATDRLVGFEALIHWENDTYGSVPSEVFLPIAAQSDLIDKILNWTLTQSVSQVKFWQNRFNQTFTLSLSLPDKYLESIDIATRIENTLQEHDFTSKLLHLQVQQNALMQETLLAQLQKLHALKIKIVIDDFGTGVSSLDDLYKLPIFAFKIYQSIVPDNHEDEHPRFLMMANIAKALRSKLIIHQLDTKKSIGASVNSFCEEAECLILHKAVSAEDMDLILKGF